MDTSPIRADGDSGSSCRLDSGNGNQSAVGGRDTYISRKFKVEMKAGRILHEKT